MRRADGTLPKKGEADYVGLADRRLLDQKGVPRAAMGAS
jgi:hypothetical protein